MGKQALVADVYGRDACARGRIQTQQDMMSEEMMDGVMDGRLERDGGEGGFDR